MLAGAALTILTSYFTGRLLARRHEPELQYALGAATLAHIVFAAGWLGHLNHAVLWPLGTALCALSIWRAGLPRPKLTPQWWWLLFIPQALLLIANALMPETNPDGYTYHLGLVREWLRDQGFSTRVGFYEMLPQQAELLFAFAGQDAARLVHLSFLAAMCSLLARMSNGWSAPLLIATTPVIAVCASAAYNDVMLAFYALATYRALQTAHDKTAALLAGACYAIKMTGGIFAAATALYLLIRKRPAAAALTTAFIAPWLIRNTLLAQNPLAPLANSWFPNDQFHIFTEQTFTAYLRTYSIAPLELLRQLFLGGPTLGGYLGVAFLATPLALLHKQGRNLLVVAAIAALPWLANAGTRFLIPSLPFIALALPPPVAILQAAAVWLHTPGETWRLISLPNPLQSRVEYLRRELPEYAIADLLNKHTKSTDNILDLVGAPNAYTNATVLSPWQHAAADRAAAALNHPTALWEFRAIWPAAPTRSIRISANAGPDPLRIQEISAPVLPSSIQASRHTAETPLAFDNNQTSGWSTWHAAVASDHLTLNFERPASIGDLTILIANPWRGMKLRIESDGSPILVEPAVRPHPLLNFRRKATRALRREGFHYLLIRDAPEGYGQIGADIVERTADWNLIPIAKTGNVHLFRVP